LVYDAWNRLVEVKDRNSITDPWKQYVYHPQYVDSIAVRYYDENTDGNVVEHYYLQDANFNVTAVVDAAGTVVERYSYTPYGEVSFLAPDFSPLTSSAIGNELLYTGRRLDPETGLQLNRNRFYAAGLGRWVNRDPIGYRGGMNLYGYVSGRPLIGLDSLGLADCYTDQWGRIICPDDYPPSPPAPVPGRPAPDQPPTSSCFSRCLKANAVGPVLGIGVGVPSLAVSLPLKPIGVSHCGAPTPTWSCLLSKIGGKGICRQIGRRCNPIANAAAVGSCCYAAGATASCACICATNPNAY